MDNSSQINKQYDDLLHEIEIEMHGLHTLKVETKQKLIDVITSTHYDNSIDPTYEFTNFEKSLLSTLNVKLSKNKNIDFNTRERFINNVIIKACKHINTHKGLYFAYIIIKLNEILADQSQLEYILVSELNTLQRIFMNNVVTVMKYIIVLCIIIITILYTNMKTKYFDNSYAKIIKEIYK